MLYLITFYHPSTDMLLSPGGHAAWPDHGDSCSVRHLWLPTASLFSDLITLQLARPGEIHLSGRLGVMQQRRLDLLTITNTESSNKLKRSTFPRRTAMNLDRRRSCIRVLLETLQMTAAGSHKGLVPVLSCLPSLQPPPEPKEFLVILLS
ncbi:hypothetical protein EYF80_014415 [Liparis tanakae]|uniref:Uncharacterized protein n=1 Tax=Liparis tanakae TaxID=230148 RepID=A0A4Z2IBJ4_9TELE|nr:hypothetical protein EYF80_014415 [Liparis tanakae]